MREKTTTADAYIRPASTVKVSIAIIRGIPAPDVRMSPADSAVRRTVPLIPSTHVRAIRTRIILCCIVRIAKYSINQRKRIAAAVCIRPVPIAEHGTVIIRDTPVPDALTKRAGNAMRCTAHVIRHTTVREHKS